MQPDGITAPRRRAPRQRPVERVCAPCGKTFLAYVGDIERGRGVYCSFACRNAGYSVPAEERFWPRVQKTEGCWPWMGYRDRNGYGYIDVDGKPLGAHVFSWQLVNGPVPPRRVVRHFVCDNPPCVRPDHLRLGSQRQNIADMMGKRRHGFTVKPGSAARGESSGMSKLTDDDVRAIRARYAAGGITQRQLATEYGVAHGQIGQLLRGKAWAHVT